ncbi:hypothetical protein [Halomonas urumqiensis]|uniref:DUF1449 domain-containing protein n=1 Tax=Halomonas urumqiensis TaxID=1684789 RepID=A0A2N7UDM5_9GAMM|nr:hypothetical protein [Halomonas urumqiensis]PMR78491.1 hypothetical protein C1H70_17265 [Halomonas urumqiensis]PTB03636.1 hypothetical protein C6V82_03895 [Halomonas urumqiensis]GHE20153.1 hypothetical protein GCM10017767_06740 [Halomonas urumqiensis]
MPAISSIALSFPVVLFSLLLPLMLLYWLLVALRLAPLELFEHDSLKGDHLSSTMVSLGFAGVPVSVALSMLLVLAGAVTLAIEMLVLRWLPLGLFRIPVGVAVLWLAFVLAQPLAAALCHRLHGWFHRHPATSRRCLLGERVLVTEGASEDELVCAVLVDDPDCLVRLHGKAGTMPAEGDTRVLVKYLADEDAYRSVAAQDYEDARSRLSRLRLQAKREATERSGRSSVATTH